MRSIHLKACLIPIKKCRKREKGMKIGDEVYIHGYIDEIRKDTVIIQNEGGYFGTVEEEIIPLHMSADGTLVITVDDATKVGLTAKSD